MRNGGVYSERFQWITLGSDERLTPDERLLDQYDFFDQPKGGPIIAYRRHLAGVDNYLAADLYFSGNIAPVQSFGNSMYNGLGVGAMGEAQFWGLISFPDSTVGAHLESIQRKLESLSIVEVARFANRLAFVLHAIDRPEFSLIIADPVSDDASLTLRCWAVLGGQAAHEKVLDQPETVVWDDAAEDSDLLINVADNVMASLTQGDYAGISTEPASFTGANVDLWGPELNPTHPGRNLSDEEHMAAWADEYSPEFIRLGWGEEDVVWDGIASRGWNWFSMRAIVERDNTFVETVAIVSQSRETAVSETYETLRAAIEISEGGTVSGELCELFDTHLLRPSMQVPPFFEIDRTSKIEYPQYLAKYFFDAR